MKISECKLGFIGFGHMAQVICQALLQAKLIPNANIQFIRRDAAKSKAAEQKLRVTATSMDRLIETSDILVIAVRPNQIEPVLKDLVRCRGQSKMIVTVLAGVPFKTYQNHLGENPQIVRVMPNIASAVSEGMSVFSYLPNATPDFRSLTNLLFSCMGETVEVSEKLMDISTAIAGSGPGFIFRLIDAMARVGEKEGLQYEKALKMAAQTFAGAARLILKGSDPEVLIEQIATPNGVTEAGFKMMTSSGIEKQLQEVVLASAQRSKELSS
jgi:pyrroline-5-carboxylate reductase